MYFNASKSNPIYSDSVSTVRVDALRGYWLIRFSPNITGNSDNRVFKAGTSAGNGAITWDTASSGELVRNGDATYLAVFGINAEKFNGIYGASSTVQPAGLFGLCLIRAYQA